MISRLFQLFKKRSLGCPEVRALASDFMDGDLSKRVSSKIESHIELCAACAAFVRTMRATVQMLSAMPRSTLPPGFGERLSERLSAERGQ